MREATFVEVWIDVDTWNNRRMLFARRRTATLVMWRAVNVPSPSRAYDDQRQPAPKWIRLRSV